MNKNPCKETTPDTQDTLNPPDQTAKTEKAEAGPPEGGSRKKRPRRRRKKSKASWSIDQFQVPERPGQTRFHDLDLPDPIMHAIADLGFEYCTPIQAKTLLHVHAGHNVSGRAQTGTGKTAAFLITIFSKFLREPLQGERPMGTPRALVLAPTRELAIQIVKDAEDLGKYCRFNCLAVYGGLEVKKQKKRLDKRPVDLIVATPGRLLDFVRRKLIDLKKIEVLVIDEADRMLDMGFIPDVKRIIRHTPPKAKRRTMLFSATLTEDVLRLAGQWMPDPVICEVEPEQVAVETVNQIVYIVTSRDKFKLLYNILHQRQDDRTLIFGNRRDHTQALVSKLKRHGIPCELLSGAVPQKKRLRILEAFRTGEVKVVVATDVAGRGLHVKDIGLVVNYEFPYEPEDYVHRIGRTGRAGVAGTAISFACEDESFTIPAIEEYIGETLKCTMPDEEMMARVPRLPKKQQPQPRTPKAR
ncbi:MAG: DEAD/DEAH box helicase [Phycisphaerales bacterium]|nr:MAG: DEAD/DEAH box helicase [Phycisphaerales bacterium]